MKVKRCPCLRSEVMSERKHGMYTRKTYEFETQVFHKYSGKDASSAEHLLSKQHGEFKIVKHSCESWLRFNMDHACLFSIIGYCLSRYSPSEHPADIFTAIFTENLSYEFVFF